MNTIDTDTPDLIPLTAAELVSQGPASPLLWRPQYLEPSSWLEHIPFAFWLTAALRPKVFVELGSYYGSSYFAFCQAVERLGLDTQCFAVDTWKGDEHAGFYEEQVYARVKQYNDARYSGFSRLVRTTFDDAVPHFADGSIDLLHIDGFHTLAEVRHDFETWLPKLSRRAVVIFHDSNVRERDFGVYRLLEDLQKQYPAFEFLHGHGLGVVGVGSEQDQQLARLYLANKDAALRPEIQELFSRMGRACADAFAANDQLKRADNFFAEVKKLRERTEELKAALEKTRGGLSTCSKTLAEKEASTREAAERHTAERAHLRERATLFQDLYQGLKEEVAGLQLALRETAAERDRGAAEAVRLVEMTQASQQQVQKFAGIVQERDARIQELKHQNAQVTILRQREAQLQEKLGAAETALGDHKQQLERSQERQRVLARQAETQQKELARLQGELADAGRRLAEAQQQAEALALQAEARQEQLAALEAALADAGRSLDEAGQQAQVLGQERDAVQAALDDKAALVATLEHGQRERDQRIADLEAGLQERDERLVNQSQELQQRRRESDERQQQLAAAEQEAKAAQRAVGAVKELRNTVAAQEAEIKRLGEEKRGLQSENEQQKLGIEQRFFELAELTRMLESATALAQSRAEEIEGLRLQAREAAQLQRQLDQKQRELRDTAAQLQEQTAIASRLDQALAAERASLEAAGAAQARREQGLQALVRRMVQLHVRAAQADESKRSSADLLAFGAQARARVKADRKLAQLARLVGQSGLFDGEWYLEQYPDVRESKADPLVHYLKYGGAEGRNPGPHFDARAYLRSYPDVLESGINPLVHYLKHGSGEGRNISGVDE